MKKKDTYNLYSQGSMSDAWCSVWCLTLMSLPLSPPPLPLPFLIVGGPCNHIIKATDGDGGDAASLGDRIEGTY